MVLAWRKGLGSWFMGTCGVGCPIAGDCGVAVPSFCLPSLHGGSLPSGHTRGSPRGLCRARLGLLAGTLPTVHPTELPSVVGCVSGLG